jgi:hypothetical protein
LHTARITINKTSGTVKLLSALTTSNIFTLTSGTFDLNGYVFTMNSTYSQTGGTFISGAATMDFNNSITLSGGTFNATTGNFYLNGAFTHTAAGTFNHNNGSIICDFTADRSWDVNTSETFYNLTINNTDNTYDLTIATNDNLIVTNNLTLTNGLLNEESTSAKLSAQGNVTVQSSWDGGSCDIEFSGTAATQNFDLSSASTLHTARITINKSSGTVKLLSDLQLGATSILTLTAGKLDLNGKNLIVTNSAATSIVRTSGYIQSELTNMSAKVHWFINTTTGAHIIPFADSNGTYLPFTLNLTAGDCDTMKVATYYTANCTSNPPTVTYLHANAESDVVSRFWQIDKTGASGTFTITFTYADRDIPTQGESNLQAQRWNGSYWDIAISGQTLTTSNNTVTVSGVTSFSPWALVKSTSPLPVNLISFSAECTNEGVSINWETASEINNDYFIIEKSMNGIDYVECSRYDISDNESNSNIVKSYLVIDTNPYGNSSYYRLKQVDLNGVYEIFNPVVVSCEPSSSFDINAVIAEASEKSLKIVYGSDVSENVKMLVYSQTGQRVFEKVYQSNKGSNIAEYNYSDLADGIYFINLINSRQQTSTKVYLN